MKDVPPASRALPIAARTFWLTSRAAIPRGCESQDQRSPSGSRLNQHRRSGRGCGSLDHGQLRRNGSPLPSTNPCLPSLRSGSRGTRSPSYLEPRSGRSAVLSGPVGCRAHGRLTRSQG